jgi:hypothetical protein
MLRRHWVAGLGMMQVMMYAAPAYLAGEGEMSAAADLFGTFDTARYTAEHIPGARFVAFPSGATSWPGARRRRMRRLSGFSRSTRSSGRLVRCRTDEPLAQD